MKSKLAPIVLLPLLLLAGCSLPPYNEDLSLALITASKMKLEARIGPIPAWSGEYLSYEHYFLPLKEAPYRGFLVIAGDYFVRVTFVDGLTNQIAGGWDTPFDNSDPNIKTYLAEPIKSAGDPHMTIVGFDVANPEDSMIGLLRYVPMNISVPSSENLKDYFINPANANPNIPTLTRVIGAHIAPSGAPLADSIAFLCALGPGHFAEVRSMTDPASSAGILNPPTPTAFRPDFTMSLPAEQASVFYYHFPPPDFPNISYLSYYSQTDEAYRNYTWDDANPTPTQLTAMTKRIDAVLSSRELLSFENGACNVHDASGNKLYSFPLGGLHFCYEKWVAPGKYRLFFSLPTWIYGYEGGGDQLVISVYSLPTENLKTLD